MKVFIAKKAGFCAGVERALDIVMRKAHDNDRTPVFTYGPIIHNPHVVKRLAALGIKATDNINKIPPGSYLVIRSHGIGPTERNLIKDQGLKIIDATCVHVKRLQQIVCDLYGAGYKLVILGLKDHPEIKALRDFVGDDCIIANSMEELPVFTENPGKVGVVAQTTLSTEFFEKAVRHFLDQPIDDLAIKETICYATIKRQEAAKELAGQVELMIVIGGLNSSNTKKLAEVCISNGVTTYQVESPDDIKDEWLEGIQNIGLTAGASTPDWMIDHVVRDLEEKGYEYSPYLDDEIGSLFDDINEEMEVEEDE
jgi:(E)-4-hydroxy-3-methyl-but-2-enyl pyrophosphate reductase